MRSTTSSRPSEEIPAGKWGTGKIVWFLCGLLWGGVLVFAGGILYLRHNLVLETPMKEDFSQIAGALEPAAKRLDWTVSSNRCGIPGLIGGQPIEIFRLCKSEYAAALLQEERDRKLSCLLPCAVSVYRKSDGTTYLAKPNMLLISRLLGGTSAGIFREKITPEQQAVFSIFEPLNRKGRAFEKGK